MADTVIKRVGGKVKIRDWIRGSLPPHNTYCEPFGGSFAVGLSLTNLDDPNYRVVFNDLDEHVANFFRVLRTEPETFLATLEATPYSRQDFDYANEVIHSVDGAWKALGAVEWARLYLIVNRQSFAGKEDGTWCISRQGENIAHTWKRLPKLVSEVAERLKNAFIENEDYREIFRRWDAPDACFYLDPPYEKVESDYYHINKGTGFDHKEMAQAVSKLQGSAVVSYYDSKFIRELYPDFIVVQRDVVKHMQRKGKDTTQKDKGREILLIRPSEWAKQQNSNIFEF